MHSSRVKAFYIENNMLNNSSFHCSILHQYYLNIKCLNVFWVSNPIKF